MPTSYTSLLGLALPVTGELSGTWGDTVNNYITQYLDASVAGTQTISGSQTAVTLSKTTATSLVQAGSSATGSSQFTVINCTGNPASMLTITAPAASKTYVVINATSTSQDVKLVGAGPTTGVTIASSEKAVVAWNGSDFVKVASSVVDGVSTISFGTTGLTPSTATSGAVTVAGTLAVANGGTGVTTSTGTGSVVLSTSPALTTPNLGTPSAATLTNATGLPISTGVSGLGTGVATALGINTGSSGAVVVNGGALGTPSSGTLTNATGLPLSTGVTGTLPIANGGTNSTATPTAGGVPYGTGTAFAFTSAGSSGQVLTSNGSSAPTWTSVTSGMSSISFGTTGLTPSTATGGAVTVAGTLAVANGGTGVTTSTGSGSVVLSSSPALTTPNLGTPSAVTLTNATGLPLSTGVTGTLTVANGGTGATTLTGVLKGNGTSAFTAATAGTDYVAPGTATTFTAKQTFTGTSSVLSTVLTNAAETTTVSATAATGTINFDVTTQSVLYYTTNASGNWTLNVRASSGTSLDTVMSTGQSVTIAFLATQGTTAYYQSAMTIDGSAITPKWQGGTAPNAGSASGIDVYTYTIIKTGSATFTVLAVKTRFA